MTAIATRFLAVLLGGALPLLAGQGPLVWSDDFNQPVNSAPDSTKWTYDLGGGGWGNNEIETYTSSRDNSYIAADPAAEDGRALVIRAVKSSTGAYTSARLKTEGLFSARYGRLEARLKTTNGQGLWPAFWMLGDSIGTAGWPACGEIDIMEVINANPSKLYGTLHGPANSNAYSIGNTYTLPGGATFDTAYHLFAVDWSPDKIVWSVDGIAYHTVTASSLSGGARWVFNDAGFFIILNLAVGGNWPGNPNAATAFPQSLTVDYVRVYAQPPVAPTALVGAALGPTRVRLAWNAGTDPAGASPTGYRVERATDAGFTQNLADFDAGDATSFVDAGALPGSNYFYRVYTLLNDGASDPTTALSLNTPGADGSAASPAVALNGSAQLNFAITGGASPTYQWAFNGSDIVSAIGPTLALSNFSPGNSGLYTVLATSGDLTLAGDPAILGITTTSAVLGDGEIVGTDIAHPNGNHFDQVLVNGAAESITADSADHRVTRTSFIDLTDDIVQVEFAGHGTLTLVLDEASGPAPPLNYNQSVDYMKGHAGIVIVGADETSNMSVFTVGRATAFDSTGAYDILLPPSETNVPANNGSPLFQGHATTHYDGIADLAYVAIASTDGKFGGLRTANASYWAAAGFTGVYAPGVVFVGPVYIGNIDAHGSATPVIIIGSTSDARITGGDLLQTNTAAVQVRGLTHLVFAAGSNSGGTTLPAQINRAILQQDGQDVTGGIVVNPAL